MNQNENKDLYFGSITSNFLHIGTSHICRDGGFVYEHNKDSKGTKRRMYL